MLKVRLYKIVTVYLFYLPIIFNQKHKRALNYLKARRSGLFVYKKYPLFGVGDFERRINEHFLDTHILKHKISFFNRNWNRFL